MLKKFASFILINIIWPLLREVLVVILRQLIKMIINAVQDLMRKWKKEEIDKSKSDEEKDDIERKYANRQDDMEALKEKLSTAADKIVENALVQGEQLRTELLSNSSPTFKSLESPKEDT